MKKIFALLLISTLFLTFGVCARGETAPDYEERLEIIPDSSFVGEYATFETNVHFYGTTPLSHKSYILISELMEAGILPQIQQSPSIHLEDNPDALRLTEETVRKVFEQTFGPDLFDGWSEKEFIATTSIALTYEPDRGTYAYTCSTWAGGLSPVLPRAVVQREEKTAAGLVLYVKFGAVYSLYEECKLLDRLAEEATVLADTEIFAENGTDLFKSGALDSYLPLYKVTYKANSEGGYYWFSTEMAEEGTPIPAEILSHPQEEAEGGNHTSLGGNWGSTSAQPSTDTQQPPADDDSAPLWGVIVGWGFVGAALIVGAVLLVKRYKK